MSQRQMMADRLSQLERLLRRVSTSETDPRDPRVRREEELRVEHNALLLAWRRGDAG